MAWFMENKLLSVEQGEQVLGLSRALCAELTPHALPLIDAFGLPEDVLAAPIAGNWVDYNNYDNQGELTTRKEFEAILKKAQAKHK